MLYLLPMYVNGKFCKDPKSLTIDDFLFKGFNESAKITNIQNAEAKLVDINMFPALNTLGVAIARVDFGPLGLNTPHWHQRGSEVFAVMKGQLFAGFVTSDNKMFGKIINRGT
ncbi:Germin-like protein [Bienertia sinuspersici]